MKTPEEIEARDLRRACYHECAHAAVARHFGIPAWIEYRESEGGDLMEEYAWTGRCFLGADPGQHLATIALAGIVAEELLGDPTIDAAGFLDYFESGIFEPSETDIEGWGGDLVPSGDLIEGVLGLVRQLWAGIETDAEAMADVENCRRGWDR